MDFSLFSPCQLLNHPEYLPWPTPFCPQHRVHGPPSLLCRHHRRHRASTGRKPAESVSSPVQHKVLHAAEGALDRSCHLVSSFGSRLSPACSAPAKAAVPIPPATAPPGSPQHPCAGRRESRHHRRGYQPWSCQPGPCCSENYSRPWGLQ